MKRTLIVHSLSRKWTKKLKQLSNKQIRQENKKEILSENNGSNNV